MTSTDEGGSSPFIGVGPRWSAVAVALAAVLTVTAGVAMAATTGGADVGAPNRAVRPDQPDTARLL